MSSNISASAYSDSSTSAHCTSMSLADEPSSYASVTVAGQTGALPGAVMVAAYSRYSMSASRLSTRYSSADSIASSSAMGPVTVVSSCQDASEVSQSTS